MFRVKTVDDFRSKNLPGLQDLEDLVTRGDNIAVEKAISNTVSNQFRLFFLSYAKAINKQEGRVGSLVPQNFIRLHVSGLQHCKTVVQYIHSNPQLHDLCGDFSDWKDSSYLSLLSNHETLLQREAILNWFCGKEAFQKAHKDYMIRKGALDFVIEE
ncbi:MAG: hypothetical protein R2778_00455 [Saprospiraceae bacterium]